MALGKVPEARRQFELAQQMNPPSPTREILWLQTGRAAVQLGRHDEALAHLGMLLAVEPRNKEARYLQAIAYVSKGEPTRARQLLDAWLAEGENGPRPYGRAMAKYGLNRNDEAPAQL